MERKFTIVDLLHLYDVVHTLRGSTVPLNEHTDPLSNEDCWNQVYDLLDKMGASFKDQLYNKQTIEAILGRKIQTYEKVYNEEGVFTGFNILPVEATKYIECKFMIKEDGELENF